MYWYVTFVSKLIHGFSLKRDYTAYSTLLSSFFMISCDCIPMWSTFIQFQFYLFCAPSCGCTIIYLSKLLFCLNLGFLHIYVIKLDDMKNISLHTSLIIYTPFSGGWKCFFPSLVSFGHYLLIFANLKNVIFKFFIS